MRAGEYENGARVLRAKIDMAAPNINLRDPVLYRIVHASHPRTGDAWCIYPTYDYAHGQSDAIEGVTHSLCTLEFDVHRALYDWLIENLPVPSVPRQYEFARLNLTYVVLSKRFLLKLVNDGRVRGWDDPRMPTLAGLRRRGYPAEGIRDFAHEVGVAKDNSVHEFAMLEHSIRNVLNRTSVRRFAVLDPVKVVIENYPEGQVEQMEVVNNPEDPSAGTRLVAFSRELWIERDDFMEEPPPKFFRLSPGREVRLRNAYFVTCQSVVKDDAGRVIELRCTYDPLTRGGDSPDGRRPKATLHWVSAAHAIPAEVRLYDQLFSRPDPGSEGRDLLEDLNPASETVLTGALLEPSLAEVPVGETVQFERLGYFCAGHGFRAGCAGVQPDDDPEGHLGEGAGAGVAEALGLASPIDPRLRSAGIQERRRPAQELLVHRDQRASVLERHGRVERVPRPQAQLPARRPRHGRPPPGRVRGTQYRAVRRAAGPRPRRDSSRRSGGRCPPPPRPPRSRARGWPCRLDRRHEAGSGPRRGPCRGLLPRPAPRRRS